MAPNLHTLTIMDTIDNTLQPQFAALIGLDWASDMLSSFAKPTPTKLKI